MSLLFFELLKYQCPPSLILHPKAGNDWYSCINNAVEFATGNPFIPFKLQWLRQPPCLSSGPFTSSVLDPFPARNTIVTWNFLRSNPNAVIWLVVAALILTRDFGAWRIDLITTEHLGLCNQFLAHYGLVTYL